jgi:acyl dehydratase
MSEHRVIARNFVADSENRIHSDDVARRYGFHGALVAGVAVYGHLTYPLVRALGTRWLTQSVSSVRFHKPAYDGETLTISLERVLEGADAEYLATCRNAEGVLLAELRSSMPHALPEPLDASVFAAAPKPAERVEMNWETVQPLQPFTPWHWQITEDLNRTFAMQVADDLPVYHEAAHPHWLLAVANRALVREYVMPAWIHVGSEVRLHRLLKVNETVEVHAVPLEKWEKKGHQFIRLYVRFTRDDELTTEIFHTAIFRVAG